MNTFDDSCFENRGVPQQTGNMGNKDKCDRPARRARGPKFYNRGKKEKPGFAQKRTSVTNE